MCISGFFFFQSIAKKISISIPYVDSSYILNKPTNNY